MAIYCKACKRIINYTFMASIHLGGCTALQPAQRLLFQQQIQGDPKKFLWFFSSTQRDLAIAERRRIAEEEEEARRLLRQAMQQVPDQQEAEFEEINVDNFFYHKEVIDQAVSSPFVRPTVKERLLSLKNAPKQLKEFQWRNFADRLRISGEVQDPRIFYRKISGAEWDAIKAGDEQTSKDAFAPVFKFHNSKLYRYWMSSSLAKVRAFGNENATDASEIIIVITFKLDPWSRFKVAPHQMPGIQGDAKVVAVHREGFAEIAGFGTEKELAEVADRKPRLDHNLGFTDSQYDDLLSITSRVERLTF